MSYIAGVRIHPGFFKQKRKRVDEYRVGASPVRLKKTSVPKPKPIRAKYAMPVVAIVAAVASFSAGAAIATAATATLGAMVVGGMMMVGAALTIVGTVTGNEKLSKIGGIMSLVGGVGALGLGAAGMLTTGAEVASGSAAGVGAAAADGVSNSVIGADALGGGAAGFADAAGAAAGGATAAPLAAQVPVTGVALDAAAPINTGMVAGQAAPVAEAVADVAGTVPQAGAPADLNIAPSNVSAPAAPPPAAGTAPVANTSSGVNTASGVNTGTDGLTNADAAGGINAGRVTPSSAGPSGSDPGLFAKYEAWAKANPNLHKTAGYVMNSVGGMIQGRNPTALQEAQINAYAASANLNEAQRQQLLTRMKNMSGVSSWKK